MTNHCQAVEVAEQLQSIDARMASIEDMLEFLKTTVTTVSNAQSTMAASAESMARTFAKFETRAEKQDERYSQLVERQDERYSQLIERLSGKEQIPLKSHYLTVIAAFLPTLVIGIGAIIAALYMTKQELKASLDEIQILEKHHGNEQK